MKLKFNNKNANCKKLWLNNYKMIIKYWNIKIKYLKMKYLELNNKIKKSLVKMKIIKSKLNNYNNN